MRLRSLILWDIRFQARYGFYFLYAVLTAIYVAVLSAVPEGGREKATAILIFSDPASMGLFFMGAIVLLEKSQRTPAALALSPVRAEEYIAAKVVSLSAISLAVAAVLAAAAGVGAGEHGIVKLHIVLPGTVMSSAVFTLLGIIIATRIGSLNQFILWTVPVELVCFVPAILHLFRAAPAWLRYCPAAVCMDMVSGHAPSPTGVLTVMALTAVLFAAAKYCVLNMWAQMGGAKL
jgi:fluoroquinolone transport system permease protein